MPASVCAGIVSAAREKSYPRRQTLFAEGEPAQQILLLTSGCVKISQFGQGGSEVILRLSGPGEIIGSLRGHGEHYSTARTLQASTALSWDVDTFEAISQRFPILLRNTLRLLEDRLEKIEQRFREVSTEKVAPRLSSELVRLYSQVGRPVNGHVEIRLSRQDLAQLTGTSLFTVSRVLGQWEMLGIVSARRESVLVQDLKALVDLSQDKPFPGPGC